MPVGRPQGRMMCSLDAFRIGKRHLIEGLILLAPQNREPCLIQRFDGSKPLLEPGVKSHFAAGAETIIPEFVIDLPGYYRGGFCKLISKPLCNIHGKLLIRGRIRTVLASATMLERLPRRFHSQYVRMFLTQPHRRCGGRCAQHHGHASRREFINRLVKPFEIESPLVRLHPAP